MVRCFLLGTHYRMCDYLQSIVLQPIMTICILWTYSANLADKVPFVPEVDTKVTVIF